MSWVFTRLVVSVEGGACYPLSPCLHDPAPISVRAVTGRAAFDIQMVEAKVMQGEAEKQAEHSSMAAF